MNIEICNYTKKVIKKSCTGKYKFITFRRKNLRFCR